MKSRNITTIIAEGTDGVGKSELIHQLFKIYNYRYMVYHRGELSNLFYAKKYHRPFSATQVGLPFLHVLLTCDKATLRKRIMSRRYSTMEELNEELSKIDDQDEFIKLYQVMKNDYHMIMVDTSNLTIEEVGKKVAGMIDEYVSKLEEDSTLSEWNDMYRQACEKLNLKFSVRGNQPYINNIMFMSESTLQNGVYETFSDKTYPDNLIYSYAYTYSYDKKFSDKTHDFAYIIYSKIKRRPEVYEYLAKFVSNKKTCIVADSPFMPNWSTLTKVGRVFGDDFIKTISNARATVYCARDLAPLRLQTARLYEAILAKQIVFVDEQSDPDSEILMNIHKDLTLVSLLRVTPETICTKYDYIINHEYILNTIINNQCKYYESLKSTVKGGAF